MSQDILYESRGAVVVITINRPEQRNAISSGVRNGLRAAFERFEADEAAQVAILTGSGDKAFCSRSEEHTSELQSLMRISYAVFCLKTQQIKPQRCNRKNIHNKPR